MNGCRRMFRVKREVVNCGVRWDVSRRDIISVTPHQAPVRRAVWERGNVL